MPEKIEGSNNEDKMQLTANQKKGIIELSNIGRTIATIRGRPLVLMFYSKEDDGGINEDDLYALENKLEERIPECVSEMDVCIQTSG